MTTEVAPPKPRRKKKPRKKGDLLPKTRTIRECERRGWGVDECESSFPGSFIKKDFIHCFDAIAFDPSFGFCGLQATSDTTGGNSGARMRKIAGNPLAVKWMQSGGKIEVWTWSMRGPADAKVPTLRIIRALLFGEMIAWSED